MFAGVSERPLGLSRFRRESREIASASTSRRPSIPSSARSASVPTSSPAPPMGSPWTSADRSVRKAAKKGPPLPDGRGRARSAQGRVMSGRGLAIRSVTPTRPPSSGRGGSERSPTVGFRSSPDSPPILTAVRAPPLGGGDDRRDRPPVGTESGRTENLTMGRDA